MLWGAISLLITSLLTTGQSLTAAGNGSVAKCIRKHFHQTSSPSPTATSSSSPSYSPSYHAFTTRESALLHRYLNHSIRYFEYGTMATKIACHVAERSIHNLSVHAVDTNVTSLKAIEDNHCVRRLRLHNRMHVKHINVDDKSSSLIGISYVEFILSIHDLVFDLVFISAEKYRLPSTLQALLAHPYNKIVIVRGLEKERYPKLLEYVDVLECVDSLVVLRRKKGMTTKELGEMELARTSLL